MAIPYYSIGGTTVEASDVVVEQGSSVTLGLTTPSTVAASKVSWSNGTSGSKTLTLEDVQTSGEYTATFPLGGVDYAFTFTVFVKAAEAAVVAPGNYLIQDAKSGRLLTGHGLSQLITFEEGDTEAPAEGQTWFITTNGTRYALFNLPDSLGVTTAAKLAATQPYVFFIDEAVGIDRYVLRIGASASNTKYWMVEDDGSLNTSNTNLTTFPFRLIPLQADGIGKVDNERAEADAMFDLSGKKAAERLPRGVYIKNGKKVIVK